ncbi:hypothetical protein Mgra_00009844 [Meloidogyne graminicola]|uniref:Uncharacterized protein n=1 Tax=Meloidogyne graminicola TaxID=189291 RepID=A0A8S9ZD73_9BILA|nr:hypothetical protein Mgra_00009844 [Meloidogyne graminicola]
MSEKPTQIKISKSFDTGSHSFIMPLEQDGSLLISSFDAFGISVSCLKYKDQSGEICCQMKDSTRTKFEKPACGWGEVVVIVNLDAEHPFGNGNLLPAQKFFDDKFSKIDQLLDLKLNLTKNQLVHEISSSNTQLDRKLDNVANEIKDTRSELTNKINNVEANLTHQISSVNSELTNKISNVETSFRTELAH